MVQKLLVILGNGNDEEGNLSETAVLRVDTSIVFLNNNPEYLVIPTGNFGDHFNTFHIAHGVLLRKYMIQKGIAPNRILPHTLSSNTVEDAWEILKFARNSPEIKHIRIITSRFHIARAKYIFGRVLHQYDISFQEASDPQSENIKRLKKHERKAITRMKKEWVDISRFPVDPPSSQICYNLGQELRHYDNLSYLSIAGGFIVLGFTLPNAFPSSGVNPNVLFPVSNCLVLLFWYLYLRLASTASSARRVLIAVEKFYDLPGISATHQRLRFLRIKTTISIVFLLISLVILLKWVLY